jgi:hypothetical protein
LGQRNAVLQTLHTLLLHALAAYTSGNTAALIAGVQEMCANLNGYFSYSTCYFVLTNVNAQILHLFVPKVYQLAKTA